MTETISPSARMKIEEIAKLHNAYIKIDCDGNIAICRRLYNDNGIEQVRPETNQNMSSTQTHKKVLARAGKDVIFTTGKHLFLAVKCDDGITRPIFTNPKMIPPSISGEWDRLSRERGLKVWDKASKKWIA